jgi:uncharacterized membrane protein YedE/YeeE
MSYVLLASILGLLGGLALGLAARLGEFCTFGAIESAYVGHDQRRLRMWGIVLGTAILTTYGLDHFGFMDVTGTIYHSIKWNPLASIFGGLVFGYGMALAGNCGFGALARVGGGDLRSMVVAIFIGISGYFALSGPLAATRVSIFPTLEATTPQSMAHLFAEITGIPPIFFAIFIAIAFFTWALSNSDLRARPTTIFWGVIAGLAITSAFWGSFLLNDASFDEIPIEGHTFTAPLGRTILFMMTSSGGGAGFAIGSVLGVVGGALIGSTLRGHFRWEACDDPRELGRQVSGACLMGFGGVIALGCSIGQGVTAFSTLAYSAPVTLAAIYFGTIIGIRHLLAGYEPE